MSRHLVWIGGLLGMTAVAAGAFGAHALRDSLTAERLETFRLATRYQLVHAVVVLALGLARSQLSSRMLAFAGSALVAGTVIFAGSLYLLCLTDIPTWGAVTPVGGLLLIIGWAGIIRLGWSQRAVDKVL